MKKLLTLIVLLVTFSSFGQVQKWRKVTNYVSTSEMVWSTADQKYLFFENKDFHAESAVWDITLDVVTGEGFITSGSITYRVNKTTFQDQDGISMIVMETFNERLDIPITLIASTIDGKFKLGAFVQAHKKVYYFYE
jgi:hypothetical protein